MFTYLRQLWKSDDLRRRILWTIGALVVYRIVAHIPVPGTDAYTFRAFLDARGSTGVLGVFTALTGGALDHFSVALLGLSPYINASIIVQLSTVIFPKMEALSKEGMQGQQELNKYMRWLSLPLAFLQSYGFLLLLTQGSSAQLINTDMPYILAPMLYVTAGSMFLLWLGEIITEKGIGNGVSLIIFAGIVTGMPQSIGSLLVSGGDNTGLFVLFSLFAIAMLIAVVLFTDAHRFIPITYANQGAGRGVQGGIPIRLNQAGMIPIIFAVSIITFPSLIAQFLQTSERFRFISEFIVLYMNPQNPGITYLIAYFLLIVAFTFFYVSVTFKVNDVAESIQKRGGFIPGMRPGQQTAKLLGQVSMRLNLWGGLFLGGIGIVPLLFTYYTPLASAELLVSGSGLIIIVGVVMEIIRAVNAQLLAHDYEKLL